MFAVDADRAAWPSINPCERRSERWQAVGAGFQRRVRTDMLAHFPDDPPLRWHNPVLALGNFDGLHRGHMKIIDRVRRRAGAAMPS